MKFPSRVAVRWLADFIGAELYGNKDGEAEGINELHKVEKGDVAYVDHPKYYAACIHSAASFIIINKLTEVPEGKALLVVDEPFEAYARIVRHFRPFEPATQAVSGSLVVGKNTTLYPNIFIGNHVTIGDNCVIFPNVTIMDHCVIGNNVIIQSGTVIGSDAFYYNTKKDRDLWYKKMPSCGRVVIKDDVEIGAGCTIDRGVSHDTVIGSGSKLDNLIHIGHDTVTGKNCLFAAQVGIAGASTIGNGVILWGQVGVSKTLSIGDNSVLLAQSGVPSSLDGGKTYFGTPAEEAMQKKKELVWIKRIPEMWEKLKSISK